jgi:branched-chain amino acid transport system substrate-binding protein
VVLGCTYYPDSVGITQAMHDQGFKPHFLALTIGPVEQSFSEAVGPLGNGIISNTSWWSNFETPGNQMFINAYKAKFNALPEYHVAVAYSAIEVLGAAVEATKSLDQAKLRDFLFSHTMPTVQGTFKVDQYGRNIGLTQELVQIQNGQIKLITPPDLAEAKLVVPYSGG